MVTFKDGSMIVRTGFYEPVLYDVSNRIMTAQFDGRGGLSRYSISNKWNIIEKFYLMLSINGVPLDLYADKEVSMIGRTQEIRFSFNQCNINIRHFIEEETNAVFSEFNIKAESDSKVKLVYNFDIDFTSYLKNFFTSRFSFTTLSRLLGGYVKNLGKKNRGISKEEGGYVVRNNILGDFYLDVAMSNGEVLEGNSLYYNQYMASGDIAKGKELTIKLVLSAGTRGDCSFVDAQECLRDFDRYRCAAQTYIDTLPEINSDQEIIKTYYKSLINCSLSMYKEIGNFKGFMAGINYQSPMRTYYRDAYWTVLSVLPVRPKLVRDEIITLARGISKNGRCPSAVRYNFKNWWGDHYDSPSFFVMMLYDYVKHTGDMEILDERWLKGTLLDAAVKVIDRLSKTSDDTGLLVKSGRFNRRDWADNVFRRGYVTYDEALYARGLYALSELYKGIDKLISDKYQAMYHKVKDSINNLLWDEEKGYYINFMDGDYIEDNLSIDTVITALFNIADNIKAKRMLKNMEKLLESKNNKEQKAGDFGVMSVFPFYKIEDAVQKSSLPYYYHNGGDWPYLSAIYAYAKLKYGMDYTYPLTRWFVYNLNKGNYTPIEFFAPPHPDGSLLQGWSSLGAFVLSYNDGKFFD